MRLSIRHVTRYDFSMPVAHGLQRLRLRPKSTHGQQVLEWETLLEGAKVEVEYEDQHYNAVTLVSVEPGAAMLEICCSGTVETGDNAGIIGHHSGHLPLWSFLRQTPLTEPGTKLRALAAGFRSSGGGTVDVLHAMSHAVIEAVAYEIGHTEATTPAEEALAAGHGVCQDHAHIFIGAARLLGIPARYVSGYLLMDDRTEQEAGHGWAEAHVDGLGWVGFDVANGICPDARYVRVATGFDYSDAAPVTGISFGAGETQLAVQLAVEQRMAGQ